MTVSTTIAFEAALEMHARGGRERCFGDLLDDRPRSGEIARPQRLMAAMRHGVLNGGKRLRPFLVHRERGPVRRRPGDGALRVGRRTRMRALLLADP